VPRGSKVFALLIEGRAPVTKLRLRDQSRRTARNIEELDGLRPDAGDERISEPCPVGRPGEVSRPPGVAPIGHRHCAAPNVADQHLVAMVGDGDFRPGRGSAERNYETDIPGQQALAFTVYYQNPLVSAGVADRHQRRSVSEPLPAPIARTAGANRSAAPHLPRVAC